MSLVRARLFLNGHPSCFFTLFGDALSAGSPLITTSPWLPPPGHEGDACLRSSDCLEGYCCARHFWTKICKPVLRQGEVCTKQRKKGAHGLEIFQRCDCAKGLSCKVWKDATSSTKSRLHMCQKIWSGGRCCLRRGLRLRPSGNVKRIVAALKGVKGWDSPLTEQTVWLQPLNSGWDCCSASAVSGPPLHPHAPSLASTHAPRGSAKSVRSCCAVVRKYRKPNLLFIFQGARKLARSSLNRCKII